MLQPFLCQLDHNLCTCLTHIIQCSLPDSSWCQVSLPFHLGGLELQESAHSATAAFLESCNSVCILASHFLSIASDQLHFPDEDIAAAIFLTFPPLFSFQHNLQDNEDILVQHLFDNLWVFRTRLI